MSKLNQLVSDCFVKLVVWLAEDTDIFLTQPLCYMEREIEIVLRSKVRIPAKLNSHSGQREHPDP
ncbi:hypothetical protein ACK317_00860 [Aeromonas dhakensis]|uniref:hypothetical protein n=1 Tax=Aeromonas dhakensis TaxID=196024 RepID=UPI0039870C68